MECLPEDEVYTVKESQIGDDPIETADCFFNENMGIHKLLVVDNDDKLCGLYTLSDIERIMGEAGNHQTVEIKTLDCFVEQPFQYHALNGKINQNELIKHVGEMVDKGLNMVAVSTAHGHTIGWQSDQNFKPRVQLSIMAGNVTSSEALNFLQSLELKLSKSDRVQAQFVPLVLWPGWNTANECSLCNRIKSKQLNVSIVADGGITKSGDIVKL